MIKLKNKDISSNEFVLACQKMSAAPLPIKAAYNVKKMLDALQIAKKKIGKEYEETIYAKYVIKEEGKPDSMPEDNEDFQKENTVFGDNEVVIDRDLLDIESMGDIKLTARDLSALEPILSVS